MADLIANGVRLHVQVLRPAAPAGPAVLFLHGLVMDNLSSFYFTLAPSVARTAEAVLFDLRGHGRSERPPRGYAVSDFVGDALGLLDALPARGPVHVVGNSFGGLLALSLAAAAPGRVASLVLLDAHRGPSGWGDAMARTLSLRGEERDEAIARGFRHWLGRHSTRKRTRLARIAQALIEETTLVEDLRASPALAEDALRAIDRPVLALYGAGSDLRPQAEELARLLPRVELAVRAGCTHSILWEETAWVRDRIVAWIREHEG